MTARGFHVIAADLDTQGMDALPDPCTRLRVDLTEPTFHDVVTAAVDDLGGRCDLLVNNAGIVVTTPFHRVTPDESRREQLINLQAPMQLSRALYPALQRAAGRIVSVVSLGAMMPLAESAGYSASKAGLRAFMLALAMLERDTGVGICMVHPGAVDTPMLKYEASNGGSALNFLSTPLPPETIAAAVLENLQHPRLETSVPRYDGWLLKLAGLVPGALPRCKPLLEWAARPGLERYRQQHGIE